MPITLEPDSFSPLPSVLVPPHHLSYPARWLDGPINTDQHHSRSSCHETDVYPWIFFHASYAFLCSRAPYVVFIVKHRGRVSSYNIQMTTPIHFRSHPHCSRSSSLSQLNNAAQWPDGWRLHRCRSQDKRPTATLGYISCIVHHPFEQRRPLRSYRLCFIIQHRTGSLYHPSGRCVCFTSQSSSSSLLRRA